MNTYINIGLDFIDAFGQRVTNVQLVNRDTGKAIAICDWDGDKIGRLAMLDCVDREQFLKEARELRENSIPVRFIETKLP